MNRTTPEPPTLTIHAQRCAHQRVASATCQACVAACPRQAWQLLDSGLAFDAALCDGCGLCVAACPHEALEVPSPTPILTTDTGRELWLACERAGIVKTDAGSSSAGLTACLHALTPDWLLQWHQRHRITQVRLASGDCNTCDRRPAQTLQARWQPVAERLARAGQPAPALTRIDARQWQARASRTEQPDPRRRRFLGQLLQGPAPQARDRSQPSTLAPLTSGRQRLVRTLAAPGPRGDAASPLWQVRLDPDRCTWCMACANLCPERALTQIADPDGPVDRLTSEMARCTGCGLCLDVCDSQALSLAGPGQPHPPAQQVFELVRQTCPVCRVSYHRQASPGGASTDEPGPCPTCRRGRPARPDRLVQTSSEPGGNGV